jgi:hypothetical protein
VSPDDSILVDAALVGTGLLTLATFGMVWKLRDDFRDLARTVGDPRNGLTVTLDRLVGVVDALETRTSVLEIWRGVQDEGEEA